MKRFPHTPIPNTEAGTPTSSHSLNFGCPWPFSKHVSKRGELAVCLSRHLLSQFLLGIDLLGRSVNSVPSLVLIYIVSQQETEDEGTDGQSCKRSFDAGLFAS
jgi:hypothetical protein